MQPPPCKRPKLVDTSIQDAALSTQISQVTFRAFLDLGCFNIQLVLICLFLGREPYGHLAGPSGSESSVLLDV